MGKGRAPEEQNDGRVYSDRKNAFKKQLEDLMDEYTKVLVVNADNVGSNQMHQIRRALRGKALVVMGKNTLVRFIIKNHAKNTDNAKFLTLANLCRLNVGLVFTNDDLKDVRDVLLANRVEAAARAGALAPNDVVIPAGPTGLEPTQTSFFQALQVPTKINKGSIEILSEVHLITKDEKCAPNAVALLNKLNIKPFSYGLQVEQIWDDGAVYSPAVLDITSEDIADTIQGQLTRIAAFSLATGFATTPAVPHFLVNGFKNLAAVCLETDYTFKEVEEIKDRVANPEKYAGAAPAASAGGAAPAAAAAAAAPEEEEDEDMGFSLFD